MTPTRTFATLSGFVLVAGLVVSAEGGGAQSAGTELRARVGVRFTSYSRTGKTGGGYVGDDLAAGESSRFYVVTGRADGDGSCDGGEGGAGTVPAHDQASQESSALYVWRFEVKMLEVMTDKMTFDLTWQRTSRLTGIDPIQETRRLTLREGESHPIDMIHGSPDRDCARFFLEATASMVEDPALQQKTIEWELWWAPGEPSTPVHTRLVSRQGEAVSVAFDPVPMTRTSTSGATTQALFQVSVQLRGRVRLDGTIEAALSTQRTIGNNAGALAAGRQMGAGRSGESGQKFFTVKPDEAVRIVLPPLGGRLQVTTTTDPRTGETRITAMPRDASSAAASSSGEMSIVVRARVQ